MPCATFFVAVPLVADASIDGPVRYATCGTYDETRERDCPGRLAFRPGDRDAACDTCGGRCGVLVATYEDGLGPSREAEEKWWEKVHDSWVIDHATDHPNGRGNCPFCATTKTA